MIDKTHFKREYIKRPVYTERIKPFLGKDIIKILVGQRRVGKSYIMYQLMDYIENTLPDSHIIYINRELKPHEFIQTDDDLYQYAHSNLQEGKKNFLFIDEVQEIQRFEYALRSLLAEGVCDITCTGSNASMLSGELATHLAGRYIEFPIHSLGYEEFLRFFNLDDNNQSLYKYLTIGGMPYLRVIGTEEAYAFEYLRNVYSTILLKDVVARENIRNVSFLNDLVEYLADNIGNLFSASNISKYLKSQRTTVSTQTVLNYLNPLLNAFFIHKVSRLDINGLKIFEIGDKYYFEDLGLRNVIRGCDLNKDIQKLLENAVYLHLLCSGYDVKVGQQGNYEIDFVGIKNGSRIYIQVAYLILDEKTREREFGNLMNIPDHYPKYVISMDEFNAGTNDKGIKQLHVRDFLKMEI
ncbi:ATP-binding protein [Parabacteroides goldsteinii]|jgi:predicted AAA+ superfamily ATPase|uniref:ATP-binding protein n=1 Tax=Parabacteroides goldsteinii TaxID=328812 RepID=UPI00101DD9EA|nr:ATP-binding protein [Parabacteroides goldsteinii]